jgi:hypothetical protein
MADSTAFPVWSAGPDPADPLLDQTTIPADRLPISEELKERLQVWADMYDAQRHSDAAWRAVHLTDGTWINDGRRLAN